MASDNQDADQKKSTIQFKVTRHEKSVAVGYCNKKGIRLTTYIRQLMADDKKAHDLHKSRNFEDQK